MLEELISKLENKKDLTSTEIKTSFDKILQGKISDTETAKFLADLRNKGETDEELGALLDKMQEFAVHIFPKSDRTLIDVCGTGGDSLSTFNISTTASFVIAAAGGAVAKHGNRSVSGILGSADIFEFFGYNLNYSPDKVSEIIEKFGIAFMFAQNFHPAMKNVANARKIIGGKTAFNILGPLTNPAQVKNQLIGVFSEDFLQRIILILKNRGAQNIMTVRSLDGMDELSTTCKNSVCFLKNGKIKSMILDPEKLKLHKGKLKDIQIDSKENALKAFLSVLKNESNKTMLEVTALNAAGGLIVSNISNNFNEALEISLDVIKSEKTYKLFEKFIGFCGDKNKIKLVDEL